MSACVRQAVIKLGNFFQTTLPVSFGRDTKSHWSFLPGVYTWGSKRSHTGKWKRPVVDSVPHRAGDLHLYTIPPPSLAVISCLGSISSSIKTELGCR